MSECTKIKLGLLKGSSQLKLLKDLDNPYIGLIEACNFFLPSQGHYGSIEIFSVLSQNYQESPPMFIMVQAAHGRILGLSIKLEGDKKYKDRSVSEHPANGFYGP